MPRRWEPWNKAFDWRQFLGSVTGGVLGTGVTDVLLQNWHLLSPDALFLTNIAVGAGTVISGGGGQVFSWFFDPAAVVSGYGDQPTSVPGIRWTFRSAFLFGFFFSLLLSVVFALLAVDLIRQANRAGEVNRVWLSLAGLSAFLPPLLGGLLSNLRAQSLR